jgi:tRNA (Thr-GGU) A37 N-methylase
VREVLCVRKLSLLLDVCKARLGVAGLTTGLTVIGLDALDGTPILDLKSHAVGFDTPYEDAS